MADERNELVREVARLLTQEIDSDPSDYAVVRNDGTIHFDGIIDPNALAERLIGFLETSSLGQHWRSQRTRLP